MSRLSIDITEEQHHRLKMMATIQKKTLKEFVLDRTLGEPENDEEKAVAEMIALLDERIKDADENGVSSFSMDEIFEQARKKALAKAS